VFERHLEASDGVRPGMDLVLWPEDVVDVDGLVVDRVEGEELAALNDRLGGVLVVGIIEQSGSRFTNEAVAFAGGQVVDRVGKERRVPFGEYVPFRSLIERFTSSASSRDAIVGEGEAVLETPVGAFGVVISWEVFFPDRARDAIGNGGTVLLNPTNGSSFSGTQVQAQQVASSRMRAIETGRWVLQAAPTGFSAIVTPGGRVVARTGVSERAVLHGTVELRTGRTWAVAAGDWLAVGLAVASLAAGWALELRSRRGRSPGRR
jgi:apolipoprotein N-acyltransferase